MFIGAWAQDNWDSETTCSLEILWTFMKHHIKNQRFLTVSRSNQYIGSESSPVSLTLQTKCCSQLQYTAMLSRHGLFASRQHLQFLGSSSYWNRRNTFRYNTPNSVKNHEMQHFCQFRIPEEPFSAENCCNVHHSTKGIRITITKMRGQTKEINHPINEMQDTTSIAILSYYLKFLFSSTCNVSSTGWL